MTRRTALLLPLTAAPLTSLAFAQDAKPRLSPHETASINLNGNAVTITYGRPYLKGRQVGNQVAPFGSVWRLGADEATKITVTKPTVLGKGLTLQPGSYSLFAIPATDSWTLIVNKTADQWGAFKYDEKQDLGRFPVKVSAPPAPVEQFTITLSKLSSDSATLTYAWGNQSVSTTLKTS